jgi:hypothetical protein
MRSLGNVQIYLPSQSPMLNTRKCSETKRIGVKKSLPEPL